MRYCEGESVDVYEVINENLNTVLEDIAEEVADMAGWANVNIAFYPDPDDGVTKYFATVYVHE